MSPQHIDFIYFVYITSSEIARTYENSNFILIKKFHAFFHDYIPFTL